MARHTRTRAITIHNDNEHQRRRQQRRQIKASGAAAPTPASLLTTMRFKAKLQTDQVNLLHSLIGPISRLTSVAVLHLDPDHVRLSTRDSSGDGIACFAELATTDGIFLNHRVESAADNAIMFEIDLTQWRQALHSVLGGGEQQKRRKGKDDDDEDQQIPMGAPASIITFKLAKRHGGLPCLCMDASCSSGVDVHHAIPIRIMKASEMQYVPVV